MPSQTSTVSRSAYDDQEHLNSPLNNPSQGKHRAHNLRISKRTFLRQDAVELFGWPSRGGVIVLENATPPDFDFLSLDPLDPPLRRDADQDSEDAFCQGLLRLGATWWDSEARRHFVRKLENADEDAFEALDADEGLEPTRLECGWVRVAWPLHTPGTLCVLTCEKIIVGRRGDEKIRPKHYGIVSLARTMDERFDILQRLGGTVYSSIDEVQGLNFLNAWDENHQGEKEPLVKEEFIDPASYHGHSDDALGKFV